MNTTTLNMTTLDGGIIIKRGEGGGSTPPSGGSNWRYWRVVNRDYASNVMSNMMLVKVKNYPELENITGNGSGILPLSMSSLLGGEKIFMGVTAVATDISKRLLMGGMEFTIGDSIAQTPEMEYLTEITEAEFYTLD